MSFIEETIVLKDTKLEEINKYCIQDNLNEIDRINYILKKGYPCQKEHLIKHLHLLYLNTNCPSFIYSIIKELIDNIELYDKKLQIAFCYSLECLAQELPFTKIIGNTLEDNRNMIKMILLHFFIAISTLEKSVSDEYIICLNKLIDYYSNQHYRLDGVDELIEYATSLGKFGQSAFNRKISVYVISNVIRISIEKSAQLYRRLLFLCDDSDRLVRFEVAYQLRYVLKEESNSKEYITKNFVPYLLIYFNEDNDLLFKWIIIESILLNITKFNNDFIDVFSKKIEEVFSINDYHTIDSDFNYFIEIFLSLLNTAVKHKEYRYFMMGLITKYLRKFYKVNELKNSTHVTKTLDIDYCIAHFDKIALVYIEENDVFFLNQLVYSLLRYAFIDDRHTYLFYSVLHKIISIVGHNKEIVNSTFIKAAFGFLDVFEFKLESIETANSNCNSIFNINSNYGNGNTNNGNNQLVKDYKDTWMIQFNCIIKTMIDNDNDTFFLFFFSKEKTFEKLVLKNDDWRKQKNIFKALKLIPQYISHNYIKYPNYEEVLCSYFAFAKEFLSIRRNYILEQEIMKFIAIMIPYAQSKCGIVEYMNEHIIFNESYFRRRLAVFFFEAAFTDLSLQLMKKLNLYQNSLDLINDCAPLIQSAIIALFCNIRNRDQDVFNAIELIDASKDVILNKNIRDYKEMFAKGIVSLNAINSNPSSLPEQYPNREEEERRLIEEKRIKEIEAKMLDMRRMDDLYLLRKKKSKMKSNSSAMFSVKKTFSKQSTLTSKLSSKLEEQGNKSKRKSSMMSMQGSIVAKDVKIAKIFNKPTTPKTLKELKNKK